MHIRVKQLDQDVFVVQKRFFFRWWTIEEDLLWSSIAYTFPTLEAAQQYAREYRDRYWRLKTYPRYYNIDGRY